jgi:hypothetical protein
MRVELAFAAVLFAALAVPCELRGQDAGSGSGSGSRSGSGSGSGSGFGSGSGSGSVQWGKGPFEVSDKFVLGELRLEPYARSPKTLEPAHVELGVRGVWENSWGWADDDRTGAHRLTLDDESRDLDLVARVGVFPRVELGAELETLHWRGGGILDPMIAEYHRTFGIGQLHRNKRPRNAYFVGAVENGGSVVSLPGQLTGLGDGAVSARVLALEGGDLYPAVALTLRAWVPVSNRHFDHARGSAETLSVDLSKRVFDWPFFVYASGAYTYYDECTVAGLHETRHRFFGAVGLEWEINSVLSLVVHFWQETRRDRKLYQHTTIPYGNFIQYIPFGLKIAPTEGLRIEIGGLENGIDPNTSGDFGFLLNVWYEFDAGSVVKAISGS